jgi:hypothetical protein
MLRYALIPIVAIALTACSNNQLNSVAKDMCACMVPYVEAEKAWGAIAQDTTVADEIRLTIARERIEKRANMEQCMSGLEMKYSRMSFADKGDQIQDLLKEQCPEAFDYFGLKGEVGE